jgi:uncharacterized membrane protein
MEYLIIKWLHILSSTLLFGTGLGTAYYMFFANRCQDPRVIAVVARHVVRADWWFTAPTVIFQPLSGLYLAHIAGFPILSGWIGWSFALYFIAGACWLPVLWLQLRMRNMAQIAYHSGQDLPLVYWRYARIWTGLGVPAFIAIVIVFYLMAVKPS